MVALDSFPLSLSRVIERAFGIIESEHIERTQDSFDREKEEREVTRGCDAVCFPGHFLAR